MKKDLLTIADLTDEEIRNLIDRALEIKNLGRMIDRPLGGYTLGLIFDKASTRTRVSFETAMFRLGGHTLFLSRGDTQLSRDEPIEDTARVLSRYLDAIAIRTFSQELVNDLARWATIPVINALTDKVHPCQVLSDLMTVKEKKGTLKEIRVAWIGDGNNVAQSWINASRILGFELILACPEGYLPDTSESEMGTGNIRVVHDPLEAALNADVINTDVWVSMGQDEERQERLSAFRDFQVNREVVEKGKPDVIVMHCLPAHREEEITADVLEGEHSVVFDQAENKMYLHQALLERLLLPV